MDIFSHAVLPFAIFWLLRRPMAERLAVGLGATMPDMDFFVTWVAGLADPLYAFTHRGWSHSLWGAPLLAVVGLVLFTRPWWARKWPRMAAFQLNQLTLLAAVLGGLSHIALDMLTITGVPLLWPALLGRVTLNLYFYSAIYMAPVAAWVVWRLYKARLTERFLVRAVTYLVVVLVLVGSVRAATMPRGLAEDQVLLPTTSEFNWYVATPVPGGWEVQDHALLGEEKRTVWLGNATPEAAEAIDRAKSLGAYVAWWWRHPAVIANTTPIEGGWRVEFHDALQLHANSTAGVFASLTRQVRPFVVDVVDGEATVVVRARDWGVGG